MGLVDRALSQVEVMDACCGTHRRRPCKWPAVDIHTLPSSSLSLRTGLLVYGGSASDVILQKAGDAIDMTSELGNLGGEL